MLRKANVLPWLQALPMPTSLFSTSKTTWPDLFLPCDLQDPPAAEDDINFYAQSLVLIGNLLYEQSQLMAAVGQEGWKEQVWSSALQVSALQVLALQVLALQGMHACSGGMPETKKRVKCTVCSASSLAQPEPNTVTVMWCMICMIYCAVQWL